MGSSSGADGMNPFAKSVLVGGSLAALFAILEATPLEPIGRVWRAIRSPGSAAVKEVKDLLDGDEEEDAAKAADDAGKVAPTPAGEGPVPDNLGGVLLIPSGMDMPTDLPDGVSGMLGYTPDAQSLDVPKSIVGDGDAQIKFDPSEMVKYEPYPDPSKMPGKVPDGAAAMLLYPKGTEGKIPAVVGGKKTLQARMGAGGRVDFGYAGEPLETPAAAGPPGDEEEAPVEEPAKEPVEAPDKKPAGAPKGEPAKEPGAPAPTGAGLSDAERFMGKKKPAAGDEMPEPMRKTLEDLHNRVRDGMARVAALENRRAESEGPGPEPDLTPIKNADGENSHQLVLYHPANKMDPEIGVLLKDTRGRWVFKEAYDAEAYRQGRNLSLGQLYVLEGPGTMPQDVVLKSVRGVDRGRLPHLQGAGKVRAYVHRQTDLEKKAAQFRASEDLMDVVGPYRKKQAQHREEMQGLGPDSIERQIEGSQRKQELLEQRAAYRRAQIDLTEGTKTYRRRVRRGSR